MYVAGQMLVQRRCAEMSKAADTDQSPKDRSSPSNALNGIEGRSRYPRQESGDSKLSMCSRSLMKQINGESVCLQFKMPKDIAGEKNEKKKNIPLCIYTPGCLPSLQSRSLTPSHRESRAVVISNVLLHSVLLAYNMKHCNKEPMLKDRTAD